MVNYFKKIKNIIKNNKNLFFKINRFCYIFWIKKIKKSEPSSYPYVSGDTFRSLANYKFDNKESVFHPEDILEGDIVFVSSPMLKHFFNNWHEKISKKYILISHNGDEGIDESYLKFIDEKIIKWFAQNVEVYHPKLLAIPIGLENIDYYYNGIVRYFNKIRSRKIIKNNRILFGFNINTNLLERKPALDCLKKNDLADKIEGWPGPYKYLKKLASYKFVASPPGNGVDCIRTWESLYLKVVPIVKRSLLTEYFFKLGFPLWIIDDWSELNNLDSSDLNSKYEELMNNFKEDILFFDYWRDKIINLK